MKDLNGTDYLSLVPEAISCEEKDDGTIIYRDDDDNIIPGPSVDILEAEKTRGELYMTSIQYKRDRWAEYPSLADQADMQFHDAVDGTTTWQDAIQAVKDAYPKP